MEAPALDILRRAWRTMSFLELLLGERKKITIPDRYNNLKVLQSLLNVSTPIDERL
jgi:hypothetical protein